jgi:hypothetical protein
VVFGDQEQRSCVPPGGTLIGVGDHRVLTRTGCLLLLQQPWALWEPSWVCGYSAPINTHAQSRRGLLR